MDEEVLVFEEFEVRQAIPDSPYAAPDSSLRLPAPPLDSGNSASAESHQAAFFALLGTGAAIAAALVCLVAVAWTGRSLWRSLAGPETYAAAILQAGERAVRADVKGVLEHPTSLQNPGQVVGVLPAGRSDVYVIKGGFVAPVQDYDFGADGARVNCVFLFETVVSRLVELNFGRELVELRKIEHMRAVKLLTQADGLSLDLGAPAESVLDVLEPQLPEATETPVELSTSATRQLADACLSGGASALGRRRVKAFASSFTLSGKAARVTYADGVGVTGVTPVGCDLTIFERDYFFQSPTFWEADLAAAAKPRGAETRTGYRLPMWELSHFFQPLLRGSTGGDVSLHCTGMVTRGGRTTACLSGRNASMAVGQRQWDLSYQSQGGFSSTQLMMRYNVQNGTLDAAEFKGRVNVSRVSEDHPLFRTAFFDEPSSVVTVAGLRRDEKPWGDSLTAFPRSRLP